MTELNHTTEENNLQVPPETWKALQGFLPVFRIVMENPDFSETDLAISAIDRGLAKMIEDVLGDELEIWQAIIEGLFFSNPEFVGRFMKQAYESRGDSVLPGEWKKKKGFYT
ncbi:MAG: hypothetical protein ACXAB4_11250 [Candidatus Hodarchaeales archaeon]